MRAVIPSQRISAPTNALALAEQGGKIEQLLAPLLQLADGSDYLIASSVGKFATGNGAFQVPRFILMGPQGGGDTVRLGLFAAIHGDDWEGAEALVEFLLELESSPQAAKGYHIHAYPICNPTGFAAGTRNNASGEDIATHFWNGSPQPEAYYLEREMGVHRFQGVISLQSVPAGDHFSASTRSSILKTEVVRPALEATRRFLTGSPQSNAADEINTAAVKPSGFLTATDELEPAPFEINFGIPRYAPRPSQIHGTISALKTILNSYRTLLAIRQDL
jgi:protein MpaA